MRRTSIPLALSLFLAALGAPLHAQVSQVRASFDGMRSLIGEIELDRENAFLETTAATLQDRAAAMHAALEGLGSSIVGPGVLDSERAQVAVMAEHLRRSINDFYKEVEIVCTRARVRGDKGYTEENQRLLANAISVTKVAFEISAPEWETLRKKLEETRSWLQDLLREAQSMRVPTPPTIARTRPSGGGRLRSRTRKAIHSPSA